MSTNSRRSSFTAAVSRRLTLVMLAGIISILAFGPVAAQPGAAPTSSPIAAAPVSVAHMPAVSETARTTSFAQPPPAAVVPTVVSVELPAAEFSAVDLAPPARPVNYQHTITEPEPAAKAAPKPNSAKPKPESKPEAKSTPKATAKPKQTTSEPKSAPTYSGVSKLWYPALGISAKWRWYGCQYGGDPDGLGPGVYRWGCAGRNNIYLMSHAWSTFNAIQRGYHSGKMKVGQSVWYANKQGDVSKWRVKWIKRVTKDYLHKTFSDWASNSSSSPIMTFQTCDGSRSQYRIIVRLVPAG